MSDKRWKLTLEDGAIQEFVDLRRKVGNKVIRAYLLKPIIKEKRIQKLKGALRGPKNEFKDFAKFLVLNVAKDGRILRILAEAGVYENLRIVGTDDADMLNLQPDEIISTFTNALEEPIVHDAMLVLSIDSSVRVE